MLRPTADLTAPAALIVAAAAIGVAVASKALYGYALAGSLLALWLVHRGAHEARRSRRGGGLLAAATGLAAVAATLSVIGSLDVEEQGGGVAAAAPSTPAAAAARESFCASRQADRLDRITGAELATQSTLKKATDEVLDLVEDAPRQAPCAVIALDAIADTWNLHIGEQGFGDAQDELDRVRRFQQEQDLRTATF